MKILAFVNKDSAPCYHRIILPFALMPDEVEVKVTNNITEEDLSSGIDVFVYNRVLPDEAIKIIYDYRQKFAFKVVVDIDDYWLLDPHHIMHDEYQRIGFAKMQVNQLRKADAVLVTNERLSHEVFHSLGLQSFILPNAIPNHGQFTNRKAEPSNKVRLFWQGSITHKADLELIWWAIRNTASDKSLTGKFKMVLGGYHPDEPEWEKMANIYTNYGNIEHTIYDGMHFSDYYQMYQHADICLVPIMNTRFNRFKSNLKVLEAANMMLPVIANNVDPYKDIVGVRYAKGTTGWMKEIKHMINSLALREDAGLLLKEFCDKKYNFVKINAERLQVLENIVG